ncbi:MAG: hypothetical protein RBT63_04590 [Bdellovibrionales bacterium]|nr:hypothetical protein [Bdellovibrionales bacterium]
MSRRFRLSIPGKTFLVGEYLALVGGPSIVLNTSPCFEFEWELEKATDEGMRGIHHPFHINSPAGQWLARLSDSLGADIPSVTIHFVDPHNGKGGLGSSSAEFFGAWVFSKWFQHNVLKESDGASDKNLWQPAERLFSGLGDYRETIVPNWSQDISGEQRFRDLIADYRQVVPAASGADLVSQAVGGIALWDGASEEMRRYQWPFTDLSMTLLLTGKKLATHTHVSENLKATLEKETEFVEDMRVWVEEAIQAFALADSDRLVASVRGVARALEQAGRVAEHTASYLDELASVEGVKAAKGCGAMGADVIAILHDPAAIENVCAFAQENGLVRSGPSRGQERDLWPVSVRIEECGDEYKGAEA